MGSTPGAFGEAEIATQWLLLTPLRPEDAEPMAGVLADERLHEFIGGSPASAADLRARYRRLAVGSLSARRIPGKRGLTGSSG